MSLHTRTAKIAAAVTIASALVAGPAVAASAAGPADTARIVPSCRTETRYHTDWFQCWVFFGSPPASCWYKVRVGCSGGV